MSFTRLRRCQPLLPFCNALQPTGSLLLLQVSGDQMTVLGRSEALCLFSLFSLCCLDLSRFYCLICEFPRSLSAQLHFAITPIQPLTVVAVSRDGRRYRGYCVFQFHTFHLAWGGSHWERQFTGDPAGCHLGPALQRLPPVQGPAGPGPPRADEAAARPLALAGLPSTACQQTWVTAL